MSDRQPEAVSFLRKLEAFFHSLARKEGLGYATGTWNHPRFGLLRYAAVFGQLGNLYVTLIGCGTDAYLKHGQVRLWWYLSDQTEPFTFERIRTTHPRPMAEWTVRGVLEVGKTLLREIRWMKPMQSVDDALMGALTSRKQAAKKRVDPQRDSDNELPDDGVFTEVDDEEFS
jgi:hypothetical protein